MNTWNGNLFLPVNLMQLSGRGILVDLTFSYNSSWSDYQSHYGYGWQFNYNMYYVRDVNGDINIVWDDGRVDQYVKYNNAYLSPVDAHDSFDEFQPGKYVLTTKDKIEYYFANPIHKRLTRLQEPNGNALEFSYDSDMRLTSLTDTVGRTIQFAYTGDNLTQITDHADRTYQFQYDSDGNLTQIIDPQTNMTQFGYDTNHLLTTITDALGNPPTTIDYSNGAVANISGVGVNKAFSYDTANLITTTIDTAPDGNQQIRYFYEA